MDYNWQKLDILSSEYVSYEVYWPRECAGSEEGR
jgi:hypothetical protein